MILAIDPGKLTGIVWGTPDKYKNDMIDFPEIYSVLDELILKFDFEKVVIENFLISGQTHKKSSGVMWSLRIIGAVEYMCLCKDVEMVLQTPSDAKNFITDKKLKEHDMWFKGAGHDRDAARHFLLWYYRNKPGEVLK